MMVNLTFENFSGPVSYNILSQISLLNLCVFLGPSGEIGLGQTGTEYDYREFTLQFPTIKYPGSYAFTVVMWNGVSE